MSPRTLTIAAVAMVASLGACDLEPLGPDGLDGMPADLPGTTEPSRDCQLTSWLSGAAYQASFDEHVARGCYPTKVQGREEADNLQFRGNFEPMPDGAFSFVSRHGVSRASFDALEAELHGQGFQRVWLQVFTPSDQVARYQATWTRR